MRLMIAGMMVLGMLGALMAAQPKSEPTSLEKAWAKLGKISQEITAANAAADLDPDIDPEDTWATAEEVMYLRLEANGWFDANAPLTPQQQLDFSALFDACHASDQCHEMCVTGLNNAQWYYDGGDMQNWLAWYRYAHAAYQAQVRELGIALVHWEKLQNP